MKIKNENTTIIALIITILIYVCLFTIVPVLTSKLSVLDQFKAFLKPSIESTIKKDVKRLLEALSKTEYLDCSKLQPFLELKCTQKNNILFVSSNEDANLVSYSLQQHLGINTKNTYDININIVGNSQKIDSISSSLDSLFTFPPKRVGENYYNIDEYKAQEPIIKYRRSSVFSNMDVIYLINIKFGDLKVNN